MKKIICTLFILLAASAAHSQENRKEGMNLLSKAYFAAGCFWSVEDRFEKLNGVADAVSGYTGGDKINPIYKEVCSGITGHAEAVEVLYDNKIISYEELVRFFFTTHDFSYKGRGNPDFVSQYRSGIYYSTEIEKNTALRIIGELERKGHKVYTELKSAADFWKAEEYHQDYIKKNRE
ncbi:MAG: peptide-methionine (S)-S-oxide reductase MsrA [Spirochaetia bacterium]|jgi:methionine-S-sulfoxide reductase|nr:peptide-methionine (S)-S-oxide reductase MsrA [Spirochaetia bacterium]